MIDNPWPKILALYNPGASHADMAKKYQIPQSCIWGILKNGAFPTGRSQAKIAMVEGFSTFWELLRSVEEEQTA